MIFATVGTQLPFDRMVNVFDNWVKKQGVKGCFSQICKGGTPTQHMQCAEMLTASQFAKKIADCKVILGHAGIGTVLTALRVQKPIIMMPRQSVYGEHRNDHQVATAKEFMRRAGMHVAWNEAELEKLLNQYQSLSSGIEIYNDADPHLLSAVSGFIYGRESAYV